MCDGLGVTISLVGDRLRYNSTTYGPTPSPGEPEASHGPSPGNVLQCRKGAVTAEKPLMAPSPGVQVLEGLLGHRPFMGRVGCHRRSGEIPLEGVRCRVGGIARSHRRSPCRRPWEVDDRGMRGVFSCPGWFSSVVWVGRSAMSWTPSSSGGARGVSSLQQAKARSPDEGLEVPSQAEGVAAFSRTPWPQLAFDPFTGCKATRRTSGRKVGPRSASAPMRAGILDLTRKEPGGRSCGAASRDLAGLGGGPHLPQG